ncbi:MAG: protein serine/threonine phosphatase [Bacteroidetes bacterium]|jgi:serine phosphatase RsbU (regulator of sigma subunit)|nr:protein serine/threonine phosphatase [Bacteroidota bacterium]
MRLKRFIPIIVFTIICFSANAQSPVDSLLHVANSKSSDTIRVNAYLELCSHYYGKGDYQKVLEYVDLGQKLSESIDYKRGIMKAIFQRVKVLISKGESDAAMKLCLQGLAIAEKAKNVRMQTIYYFQIGQIFEHQRNYKNALNYYEKAFQLAKKNNYEEMIDAVVSNMGNIFSEQGDHSKAINYYYQSLAVAMRKKDSVSMADSYVNIGNEYFFQDNKKEAMNWYSKAAAIYERNEIKSQLVVCDLNIASILMEEKQYEKSLNLSEKAIRISKELKQRSYVAEGYLNLANTYSRIGNYKQAYVSLQQSKNYYDSVYNEDMIAQTTELQTKYETDKKEKENQILKQQNELQDLNITRQKIISYSVSFGLMLMLILAFLIFRGYKQKQKANELLGLQNWEIRAQKSIIEEKSRIVEEKNKDITDSIRYAKRLQSAILKPEENLSGCFDDGFILFRPKDIVSGDFYWFEKFGKLSMIAASDCTGHGVPGAFMSIIGCNLLTQAVNEYAITKPSAILNSVNKGLSKVLQQKKDEPSVKDGMDIALCVFDPERMILEYAGAYNPLWLVRDGNIIEFKADKFPVGAFVGEEVKQFSNHEISVVKGDVIYLFSDGYADQFGGKDGKKFKYKSLQQLFLKNYLKSGQVQKNILNETFDKWIGELEQVDDVLVIGVKI